MIFFIPYSTNIPNEILEVIVQELSLIDLATLSRLCSVLRVHVETHPVWNEIITATRTPLSGRELTPRHGKILCQSSYHLSVGGGFSNKTLPMFNQDTNKFQLTCLGSRKEYYQNHDDDMVLKLLIFSVS